MGNMPCSDTQVQFQPAVLHYTSFLLSIFTVQSMKKLWDEKPPQDIISMCCLPTQVSMDALAEVELDDAEDFTEDQTLKLNPTLRERGSVQLSGIAEPVTVHGWPMGLVLASAPSTSVSLTATGFQKMVSLLAFLALPSSGKGEYRVETNQYRHGLASIRAQPRVSTDALVPV